MRGRRCRVRQGLARRNVFFWVAAAGGTGLLAVVVLLALPDVPLRQRPRPCPKCLGMIPAAATRCRRCGADLAA